MNNPLGIFSKVPKNDQKYTKFNKSCTALMSMPSCKHVPIKVFETTTGERGRIRLNIFARIAPMLRPAFGDLNIHVNAFAVPKRIVDDQFEQWFTRGPRGKIHLDKPRRQIETLSNLTANSSLNVPKSLKDHWDEFSPSAGITEDGFKIPNAVVSTTTGRTWNCLCPGMLLDYLGYPVNSIYDGTDQPNQDIPGHNNIVIDSFYRGQYLDLSRWFAYWLIWDEYYRNQALSDPLLRDVTTGVRKHIRDFIQRNSNDFSPWYRQDIMMNPFDCALSSYDDDYFTSLRPSPTLGDEVHIPFSPVFVDDENNYSGPVGVLGYNLSSASQGAVNNVGVFSGITSGNEAYLANFAALRDFDAARALQRWQNISSRFNNRYDDVLFGHFGVRTSNRALQRPEYLGGGVIPVHMSDVLNTTSSEFAALGELGGRALANGSIPEIEFYTEEPSFIFFIASIKPVAIYWQGIDRLLQVFESEDDFWPEFQHIGMQEVYKKEVNIYAPRTIPNDAQQLAPAMQDLPSAQRKISGNNTDGSILGYQTRFARYKFEPDTLSGLMRTDYKDWVLSRDFGSDNFGLNLDFTFAHPSDVNKVFSMGLSDNDSGISNDNWHNFIFECRFTFDSLQKMDFLARTY